MSNIKNQIYESDVLKARKKQKTPQVIYSQGFVDRLGLEPRMTEPKSAVLPLHHRSILECKCIKKKSTEKFFLT